MTGSAERPAAHHPDGDSHKTLDRLMSFSDAVFAIAMTLLVVQFTVPAIPRGLPRAEVGHRLASELAALGPAYFSFGLTFVVVAIYWIGPPPQVSVPAPPRHWVDLAQPAVAAVRGVHPLPDDGAWPLRRPGGGGGLLRGHLGGDRGGVGGDHGVCELAWARCSRPRELRFGIARAAVIPLVFVASIPLALVSPSAAEWSWLAIFVVNRLVEARRRHHGVPG